MNQYRLGIIQLESRIAERDLGVLVEKLNISQQCAFTAKVNNSILDSIRRNTANRSDLSRYIWCIVASSGLPSAR